MAKDKDFDAQLRRWAAAEPELRDLARALNAFLKKLDESPTEPIQSKPSDTRSTFTGHPYRGKSPG